ncbi:UTS1 protein, partial [Amia calva]|nr:UTS1 protein [Amia calva]
LDPVLSYTQHITTLTRTCRFFLSNIRRIRPFLTNYSTQLLVQSLVLSRLDYCNSLLVGLPATTTRTTPLLHSLHWLPIPARIQFKTLTLTYRCLNHTAPSYLQTLVSPHIPSRPLWSSGARRLTLPLKATLCVCRPRDMGMFDGHGYKNQLDEVLLKAGDHAISYLMGEKILRYLQGKTSWPLLGGGGRSVEEGNSLEELGEMSKRAEDPPISIDLTFHLLRNMIEMARIQSQKEQAEINRKYLDEVGK